MMTPYAHYWRTADKAGYANALDWKRWADQIILGMPQPPFWVIAMSIAKDRVELAEALESRLDEEIRAGAAGPRDPVVAGYYWLRYKRGEMTLYECIGLAGDLADSIGDWECHCGEMFHFLNRLDAGESEAGIESEAAQILRPLAERASEEWATLAATSGV
jgi:hypothetical protein